MFFCIIIFIEYCIFYQIPRVYEGEGRDGCVDVSSALSLLLVSTLVNSTVDGLLFRTDSTPPAHTLFDLLD